MTNTTINNSLGGRKDTNMERQVLTQGHVRYPYTKFSHKQRKEKIEWDKTIGPKRDRIFFSTYEITPYKEEIPSKIKRIRKTMQPHSKQSVFDAINQMQEMFQCSSLQEEIKQFFYEECLPILERNIKEESSNWMESLNSSISSQDKDNSFKYHLRMFKLLSNYDICSCKN